MRLLVRLSAPALYVAVAVFAIGASVYRPVHNWDVIGYIAVAKSFEEQDVQALHSFTYEQLWRSVPEATYASLTQASRYRQEVSADAAAFQEQLPFYKVRPLYTGLIFLLYKAGMNIVFASHIISGTAIALALLLLYLMAVTRLAPAFVYAIPPLAIVFGVLELARASTPDGLAYLGVVLAALLYMAKRLNALLILLPILLGIRHDLVLFTLPLLLLIFVVEKSARWRTALSATASVGIFLAMVANSGHPGWSTTFYHTFVQTLAHPLSTPPALAAPDFAKGFLKGVTGAIDDKSFVLYTLLTAYWLLLFRFRAKSTSVVTALKSPTDAVAVVCLVFIAIHFLAFPAAWTRFFAAQYLMGAFALLSMLRVSGQRIDVHI